MEEIDNEQNEHRRPLAMVLLGGLYLFFFLLNISTFGAPFPFLGYIYKEQAAQIFVFLDSLVCLYLFLGLMKRQTLTWYLLIAYNCFELINTVVNIFFITPQDLEKTLGTQVDQSAILVNNISVAAAIVLLTLFIFRHRQHFNNPSKYLF